MTKVVIAHGWTDPKTGKAHKPGQTAEVTPAQARDLLKRGEARPVPAEAEPSAETTTEVAKPAPARKNPSTKKEASE